MKKNREKWIEDRAAELEKAPEPTAEDAALIAGPPDAELLQMVTQSRTVPMTRQRIDNYKKLGLWNPQTRVQETCVLRAIVERGVYDVTCTLGASVYTLPVPELARRLARLEVATAEQVERAEFVALLIECIFGRGTKVARWSCSNGHEGYAQQEELLAIDPCPYCGLLLQKWRAVN